MTLLLSVAQHYREVKDGPACTVNLLGWSHKTDLEDGRSPFQVS